MMGMTHCYPTRGPTFGSGRDIGISPGGDAGQSYTDFSYSSGYADTLGRDNATFTGARDFTPVWEGELGGWRRSRDCT
jgi:hypothetical protein